MQVYDLNLRQKTPDKVKKGVEEQFPCALSLFAFAWKYDIMKSWIFMDAIVYKNIKEYFLKNKEENHGREHEESGICKN